MQCGKPVVMVEKSPEETRPTQIFEHELKIMRSLYPTLRVVGRVLDEKGKRATFPLGTPEEEFNRRRRPGFFGHGKGGDGRTGHVRTPIPPAQTGARFA